MAQQHNASPDAAASHGRVPTATRTGFTPVQRRPRADGWTIEKQRDFIEALADTGSVRLAAQFVGMHEVSAYRLRRLPEAAPFAAAWELAVAEASKKLLDVAMQRALYGVTEAILDREGNEIAQRTRYNDRLLMFLLRARQPAPALSANPTEATPQLSTAIAALAQDTPPPDLLADPTTSARNPQETAVPGLTFD